MNLNKRKIEKPHGWDLGLGACGVITWLKRSWISRLVKMEQWSFGQWGLGWHDRSLKFSMALLESSWSIEKSDDEQTGLSSNWSFSNLASFLWTLEQWSWTFDFLLWNKSICQFCTWSELFHCVNLDPLAKWTVSFKLGPYFMKSHGWTIGFRALIQQSPKSKELETMDFGR